MLSNFPIEYLDNEKMRPIYWSHPKSKTTNIYGFGLNYVQDSSYEAKKKKKLTEAKDHLMEVFSSRYLTCCKKISLACKVLGKSCKNCCGCNVVEKDLAMN